MYVSHEQEAGIHLIQLLILPVVRNAKLIFYSDNLMGVRAGEAVFF